MRSFLSKAPLLWGILVIVVSIAGFLYLVQGDAPVSRTVIPLGYYESSKSLADAISQQLTTEIKQNKFYWLGVEPEKKEQIELAAKLIQNIKAEKKIDMIIVDQELALKSDQLKELTATEVVLFKDNLYQLAEKLQQLEKNQTSYILVTASIYTSSLLKKNPAEILRKNYGLEPFVLSAAYFSTDTKDEMNSLFQCSTEDHTGTSDWGCFVLNKSRFARRKFFAQEKPWVAIIDAINSNEYILLVKTTH